MLKSAFSGLQVFTTLSLTIRVYLNSFSCRCLRNLRNVAKSSKIRTYSSSRSSMVINLGVNRQLICNFLL